MKKIDSGSAKRRNSDKATLSKLERKLKTKQEKARIKSRIAAVRKQLSK